MEIRLKIDPVRIAIFSSKKIEKILFIFRLKMNCERKGTRKCTICRTEKDLSCFDKKKYNNKLFKTCLDCKAKRTCEHGHTKIYCIRCIGACMHGKVKKGCNICNPNRLCKHKVLKSRCLVCTTNKCKRHGKIRSDCTLCTDPNLCFYHSVEKSKCKPCNLVRLLAYNPFDPFSEYKIP